MLEVVHPGVAGIMRTIPCSLQNGLVAEAAPAAAACILPQGVRETACFAEGRRELQDRWFGVARLVVEPVKPRAQQSCVAGGSQFRQMLLASTGSVILTAKQASERRSKQKRVAPNGPPD